MESLELVDLQRAVNTQKTQHQLDPFKLDGLLLRFLPLYWTFPTFCHLDVGSNMDLDQRSLV